MIVGIDEVGRGAWAGPLVVGAVLLGGVTIEGLTDSKLLSKKQRTMLDIEIRQKAVAIGLGWVSAKHIDEIGLSEALKLASRRALLHIRHDYREIIIDGTIKLIDDSRVTLMKKADLLVPSVSAASVVAKVARDNYMRHADTVFPGYKFRGHVGYGTKAHRTAIAANGVTPLHRLSYEPLKKYQMAGKLLEEVSTTPALTSKSRRTFLHTASSEAAELATAQTSSPRDEAARRKVGRFTKSKTGVVETPPATKRLGDAAEALVAALLEQEGHAMVARNWRTKFCEIDIVSKRGGTLYFTEVKYRKNDNQGGGVAAITSKKLQQMAFAAELFVAKNNVKNMDLRLMAADVAGTPPRVKAVLELG